MGDIFQAVIAGDLKSVQYELAHGASPNMIGQDSLTLLHYAAMANQPAIFSLLLSQGAAINAKDPHNNMPLYYAARSNGSKEFIDFIISSGADINNQNKIGQTALHTAARLGSIGALDSLLTKGADVNIKDIQGKTALHDAIVTNHPNEILLLIEFGANLHSKDKYNHTPIDVAQTASLAIQQIFALPILESIQLPAHNTLLQSAAINDVHAVKVELDKGVSAFTANSHGMTGLHYAALNGYPEMIQEFVNHGAFINQTTDQGLQPLHLAAMAHQLNVVDTLLNSHAAINAIDYQGNTPLHYAVQHGGSAELVTKILDAGASIDTVNKQGETALHLASADGNFEAVKVLIAHHANKTIYDTHGETPVDEAVKKNHADIATYLKEHNKSEAIKLSDVISESSALDVLSESGPVHANNMNQVQATTFVQESILPVMTVETVM